jgi:hypothetical protein
VTQQIDGSMTQMLWRAPLLRLTQIPVPDLDEGQPTVVFVDPQQIGAVRRLNSGYAKKLEAGPAAREFHPMIACTEVHCCHYTLLVVEMPEEVAMLRDRALGHEPPRPRSIA